MARPMGKHVGVTWSLQLHPDDSRELEAGLLAHGYEATKEGLTDFIFDRLKEKSKNPLLEQLAGIMQDPAKGAIIEKAVKVLFQTFRR